LDPRGIAREQGNGMHVPNHQILIYRRPCVAAADKVENPDQVEDIRPIIWDGREIGNRNLAVNAPNDVGHYVVMLPTDEHDSAQFEHAFHEVRLPATNTMGNIEFLS
jgi:hypothetical protein